MSGRVIMVDIDDTLLPMAAKLHERAFEMGLHDGTETALRVWHGHEQYGCSREAWGDVFASLAADGFYTTVHPYPGAIEAVRAAWWDGDEIHLVTARGFMEHGEEIRRWTEEWLRDFGVPGELHFAQDKARIAGLVRATHGVDDGYHNWKDLQGAGVSAYLVNQPHNENDPVPNSRRVDSVVEFFDRINQEEA